MHRKKKGLSKDKKHHLGYKTAQQESITSIDAITTVEAYQQRRATMRAKYPHYSNIEKKQIQEQLTLIKEYRENQVKDQSEIYAPEFQRYATADNIVRTWNTHGLLLPTQPSPELPGYGKAFTYIEPKHRDEVIDGYIADKQGTGEKNIGEEVKHKTVMLLKYELEKREEGTSKASGKLTNIPKGVDV